jgi:hypothetical protein
LATPVLQSHNLADGAPRNFVARLDFSTALLPSSVSAATITLVRDDQPLKPLACRYELANADSRVVITPEYLLDAEVRYRLVIGTGVKASTGEALAAAVTHRFLTSAELTYTPAVAAAAAPSVTCSISDGAYGLATNPGQGDITTEIVLVFSKAVKTADWQATAFEDLPVSLRAESINGDPRIPSRAPELSEAPTVDGATVTLTLAAANGVVYNTIMNPEAELSSVQSVTFLPNNLITLEFDPDLEFADGTTLGAVDPIVFSTELFPHYGTFRQLFWDKRHLLDIIGLSDREMDYLIFQESSWLATMMLVRDPDARTDLPTQTILDYVRCKIMSDVLNEAVARQAVHGATEDKQLGQFRVSRNWATTPKALTDLIGRADKCWRDALESVLPVATFTSAIRGLWSPYARYMNPNGLSTRRIDGAAAYPANPWGHFASAYQVCPWRWFS